jgi:hypothetical protein
MKNDRVQQLATSFAKKLIKQAQNQHVELMQYLMRAVTLAAHNVGVDGVIVTQVDLPKENGIVDTYASNIPEEKLAAVKGSLDKMLAGQRPELAGKVNLMRSNY